MAKISIFPFIAKKIKKCLGIVEDTDIAEHTIALGKYVVWKGNLCKSSEAIPEGAALSSSNLTDVPDGGLNELNSKILKHYQTNISCTYSAYSHGGALGGFSIPNDAPFSISDVVSVQVYDATIQVYSCIQNGNKIGTWTPSDVTGARNQTAIFTYKQ